MKIVRKNRTQITPFADLDIGEIFVEHIDGDEFVQMKLPLLCDEAANTRCNAVLLETGEICYIADYTKVELVEATLTIE